MSQKKFTRLANHEIKCTWLIFKTRSLIYQSQANLHEKILFGKITHLDDPIIRKMPARSVEDGDEKFHVPFWSMIYVALKFTLLVSKTKFQRK